MPKLQAVPIAFGPVPSRRLGRSLGINNVPPKACSYSCVYCQVGRTPGEAIEPRVFFPPAQLIEAVTSRLRALQERGQTVDFLTFVPDGEPTLDRNLAAEIDGLRPLGVPIAVISNGSLLWRPEVRATLARADWVSLKVDAVDEGLWRRVNRPHDALRIDEVLDGMLAFSKLFEGKLATETMLIRGANDTDASFETVAAFLQRIEPDVAYVAAPTRPPAEGWVEPASENVINRAFQCLAARLPRVELLIEFEGTEFGHTGDPAADLLATTAVHPMREDAVLSLLARSGADRSLLESLVSGGLLRAVRYRGSTFYVRPFPKDAGRAAP